jgi:hypothetical protein
MFIWPGVILFSLPTVAVDVRDYDLISIPILHILLFYFLKDHIFNRIWPLQVFQLNILIIQKLNWFSKKNMQE